MSNLPTRKAEDWRYADLAALEKLWPLPDAESITVAAGDSFARAIVNKGGVVRLSLTLEAGAKAAVHVLNSADAYARIEIEATLHEGADFTLGGVQLASGAQVAEIVATVRHIEPSANSRQILRSVAAGTATACAIGELDANGLFYMAARGIEPARAKALMLQAFIAEAFDGAEDEDHLQAAAQAALEALL
jgi:Fe-S cluster assembly protein SufD